MAFVSQVYSESLTSQALERSLPVTSSHRLLGTIVGDAHAGKLVAAVVLHLDPLGPQRRPVASSWM